MSGTQFRGVSLEQDKRFKDKDEKELRKREYPANFSQKVHNNDGCYDEGGEREGRRERSSALVVARPCPCLVCLVFALLTRIAAQVDVARIRTDVIRSWLSKKVTA